MIQPQVRIGRTQLDDTTQTEVARREITGLPGVIFTTIECQKPAGGWAMPRYTDDAEYGLTLVRRGASLAAWTK